MAGAPEMLTLEVATPLGLALRTKAESVQAPSVAGEFGVLAGHLPLLAALKAGLLRYRVEGKDHFAAVGHGFVEAGPEKVLLLTDQFALPKDIDLELARKELVDAEARLRELPTEYAGPDYEGIQRAADWAQARIDAVMLDAG